MDHLEMARKAADRGQRAGSEGLNTESASQLAIAHALIALVERLDAVIDRYGLDEKRGYLRVDAGIP